MRMSHTSEEQIKSKFVVADGTPLTIVHDNMEEEDFMEGEDFMVDDEEFMEEDSTEGQEQFDSEDAQKAIRYQYHYFLIFYRSFRGSCIRKFRLCL